MKHVLSVALLLAGAGACTFPNLRFDSTSSDGGPDDRGSSSSSGVEASSSGTDAEADVATTDAPSSSSSSGGEAGSPCDQDGDGFRSNSAECGGFDCCDTDSNAHPGQGAWFSKQDNCGSFDYDCDSKEEHEYTASLGCALVWSVGCLASCSETSCSCGTGKTCDTGYVGPDPGCGAAAEYDECQPANAVSCTPSAINPSQVQACH